jgi:DNA-binding PadR family transcriptional regulator
MTNDEKNIKDDFEYSRATYYELLEKGKESLMDMMEVARSSEHPRAYEVLSNLIKNMADVNDKLMELNKKKKDLDKNEETKQVGNTTNNLFVGTTTDLQKLLRDDEQVIDVTNENNAE